MVSKNNSQEYPIQVLREKLRRQSSEQAAKAGFFLFKEKRCNNFLYSAINEGCLLEIVLLIHIYVSIHSSSNTLTIPVILRKVSKSWGPSQSSPVGGTRNYICKMVTKWLQFACP